MAARASSSYVCVRCAGALLQPARRPRSAPAITINLRQYSHEPESSRSRSANQADSDAKSSPNASSSPEPGPMSRRLEQATEDALFSGGRAGRRAVEDAGFSEELKDRLLAKVKDAQFRSEHASAFAEAGMSISAGQRSRLTAASQAWAGKETTEDAVLRMLNDDRKTLPPELRGKPKLPHLQSVDMRFNREGKVNPSARAASARDKVAAYTGMGIKDIENGLSDKEREAFRKELKERFRPAARAIPTTLTGLASLANERIEDAIARGQFKHIPRGKGVERDVRSDNPFVDTTEYILNKMIKRQEIIPPWIEKQQELVKAVHVFRSRLRNDWKRHMARTIASKGGSLQDQMNRAMRFARAEDVYNPRRRNVDQISVPTNATEDPIMAKLRQQLTDEANAELASDLTLADTTTAVNEADVTPQDDPLLSPFRDPDWLKLESSYMNLAIENLNALARSYNLMAPELAKKPYFSLERELNNCYADVAPQLADAIKERAFQPPKRVETIMHRPGSILGRFSEGHTAKVYESRAPHYGFKEMWHDLWDRSAG